MTKTARNYSCELAESKILVCFKFLSLRTAAKKLQTSHALANIFHSACVLSHTLTFSHTERIRNRSHALVWNVKDTHF